MTAPPWGHKPPPVDDPEDYWTSPPPELSPRCQYWVRRYREGTWHPNRRLRVECGNCQAGILGVYVWEAREVIAELIVDDHQRQLA